MLEDSKSTLNDISKINELNIKIESINRENEMLKLDPSAINQKKIMDNIELIDLYNGQIDKIKNECRIRWNK